jgi:hypothetical protein
MEYKADNLSEFNIQLNDSDNSSSSSDDSSDNSSDDLSDEPDKSDDLNEFGFSDYDCEDDDDTCENFVGDVLEETTGGLNTSKSSIMNNSVSPVSSPKSKASPIMVSTVETPVSSPKSKTSESYMLDSSSPKSKASTIMVSTVETPVSSPKSKTSESYMLDSSSPKSTTSSSYMLDNGSTNTSPKSSPKSSPESSPKSSPKSQTDDGNVVMSDYITTVTQEDVNKEKDVKTGELRPNNLQNKLPIVGTTGGSSKSLDIDTDITVGMSEFLSQISF